MNFAELIDPITVDEFKRSYLNTNYLRIPGGAERFATFVPWATLNQILVSFRTHGNRLQVVREGRTIDPSEYLRVPSDPSGTRVNAKALERRLRLGDTLVLTAAHELFPAVQLVLESIEQLFRIPINANLYAGFRRSRGFDLHWDGHDTLIVQVHGRKAWRVYEPTRPFPLSKERPQDMVRPTRPPVWDGLLNAGDVLYMPRGWWHIAEPVDGPSLHVTFGIGQPTGLDLLKWFLQDLDDVVAVRQALPTFGSEDDSEAFLEALRQALSARLTGDVIERYLRWTESRLPSRHSLALPEAATPDPPVAATTLLVLADCRRLPILKLTNREIGFWGNGRFWRCNALLRPALEYVNDRIGRSPEELAGRIAPDSKPLLGIFLKALVEGGVLTVCRDLPQPAHVDSRS